jgi:hypothetical protein
MATALTTRVTTQLASVSTSIRGLVVPENDEDNHLGMPENDDAPAPASHVEIPRELTVFGEHIGRTVEAYVNDIVVKTRKASDLLSYLEVTFGCLRAKGVKLNPEKCVFGVPRGMLLGFIISERGIEANPEKIVAITNMGPIKDLKGVQRVMECLAALSCFISRLGEKRLPLYRLLRKAERFTWTPEAEEGLGNLKALLTNAPILVPPAAGEALLIYVAATTEVVSAAVVVERREEGHALLI